MTTTEMLDAVRTNEGKLYAELVVLYQRSTRIYGAVNIVFNSSTTLVVCDVVERRSYTQHHHL